MKWNKDDVQEVEKWRKELKKKWWRQAVVETEFAGEILGRREGRRGGKKAGLRREKGALSLIPRVWTRVWGARSEGCASHQGVHASVATKHSLLKHTEVAPGYKLEIRCYKQVLAMAVEALSFSQWRLCQSILTTDTSQPVLSSVYYSFYLMVQHLFFVSGTHSLLVTGLHLQRQIPTRLQQFQIHLGSISLSICCSRGGVNIVCFSKLFAMKKKSG